MNGRRAKERRRQREACKADPWVACVAGWCQGEDDLDEARRQTHDALIRMLGSKRRSGVSWSQWTGSAADDALHRLRDGAAGELADHYRHLGGMLREYGGWLVVASAEAKRRDGVS